MLIAYSYKRFSSPEQATGDSLRRQIAATEAWCLKNKVELDASTRLVDEGKSAFVGSHRENPDRNALARFLKLVEDGRVPRGSYLILESLDRLTREDVRPALSLVLDLIEKGVRLVQLNPTEMVYDEDVNEMQLLIMIMELSRGHSESKMKSVRVGAAWSAKRQAARKDNALITRKLPAWCVTSEKGKVKVKPGCAATIRKIFALTIAGHGTYSIRTILDDERVPTFNDSTHWTCTYLRKILQGRQVLGEHQPCKRAKMGVKKTVPDGEPIVGYLPRIIDEKTWLKARACSEGRTNKPGRRGATVNLFANLITDAATGGTFYCVTRVDNRTKVMSRSLISSAPTLGKGKGVSFPLLVFETEVLNQLGEIDPRDILGESNPATDDVLVTQAELTRATTSLDALAADMNEHGESPGLLKRFREREAQILELNKRLSQAVQKAANPAASSWAEAKTLLGTLQAAPDQQAARLRLRSCLRSIIERVLMLVVNRGTDQIAVAHFIFYGSTKRRTFQICHRRKFGNAKSSRPACVMTWQWDYDDKTPMAASKDWTGYVPGDLETPEGVERERAACEQIPKWTLDEWFEMGHPVGTALED